MSLVGSTLPPCQGHTSTESSWSLYWNESGEPASTLTSTSSKTWWLRHFRLRERQSQNWRKQTYLSLLSGTFRNFDDNSSWKRLATPAGLSMSTATGLDTLPVQPRSTDSWQQCPVSTLLLEPTSWDTWEPRSLKSSPRPHPPQCHHPNQSQNSTTQGTTHPHPHPRPWRALLHQPVHQSKFGGHFEVMFFHFLCKRFLNTYKHTSTFSISKSCTLRLNV